MNRLAQDRRTKALDRRLRGLPPSEAQRVAQTLCLAAVELAFEEVPDLLSPILEVVRGTRESSPGLVGTAAGLAASQDDEYLSTNDSALFRRARALDAVARLLAGDAVHEVVYEAVIGCGLDSPQVEAAFDRGDS